MTLENAIVGDLLDMVKRVHNQMADRHHALRGTDEDGLWARYYEPEHVLKLAISAYIESQRRDRAPPPSQGKAPGVVIDCPACGRDKPWHLERKPWTGAVCLDCYREGKR